MPERSSLNATQYIQEMVWLNESSDLAVIHNTYNTHAIIKELCIAMKTLSYS